MNLEALAFAWLRIEKRCPLVLMERTPRLYHGRPDVIGVTESRHLVEIEIKRTMADFRANAEKYHIKHREVFLPHFPRLFWFLVPIEIVPKVERECPIYAGILTPSNSAHPFLHIVKKATPNKDSRRLTVKEVIRTVTLQSNQLLSMVTKFPIPDAATPGQQAA